MSNAEDRAIDSSSTNPLPTACDKEDASVKGDIGTVEVSIRQPWYRFKGIAIAQGYWLVSPREL